MNLFFYLLCSDCGHSCSLCKQTFVGLLEFTDHLHGESHQEKLHKWKKDQQQEWSPDKQKQQQHGSPNQHQENRPPSDWSTDDFIGFVDYFSDNTGEVNMGDNWHGGRGPPRHPREIPSHWDFRYQEQFDRRRDRRDQYAEREYPPWSGEGRDRPREFRDSPPLTPETNYSYQEGDHFDWRRDAEGQQYDRNHDNRDEDLYSSREFYPSDGRRTLGYDVQPECRSRRENQPRHYDNRNIRRNSNSPQRQKKKVRSVIGSAGPSRKENDRRPNSRNSKTEGYSKNNKTKGHSNNKQKESPSDKQAQGENGTKRKASVDRTPPKNTDSSPSSGTHSGGKNTRKGKPRKLARPAEEKRDELTGTDSTGSGVKDATQAKSSEREVVRLRRNTLEITVRGKEKDGTEAVSQCNDKDKKDTLNVKSSTSTSASKGKTLTKPARNYRKTEETLPTLTEKHEELPSSNLERVSLSSSSEKTELASNSKHQNESSATTDKLLTSSKTQDKHGLPSLILNSSGKEKAFDSSVFSENRQKSDDTECSSENIRSSPWEQREERLRSLLGIKKEPKDSEVTYLEHFVYLSLFYLFLILKFCSKVLFNSIS